MSFSDSSQDYSQYVQSKVYQPIMSSLNDDGLARRVEKLERDNAILDRYIQDLYKKMSNSTGTQSENHTPSKAMAELEFRLDKIEKLLSLQAIGRKFGKENQDINQDYFNRCQRISSDYDQQQVRHEDLDRLETKLVKLMKTQAEDIAVDVTDLEKYTQRVDSKLRNFCLEDHVTRKEFHQLEKILDKKIEISTNLMEGVLSEAREIISKAATLRTRFPEKSENMSPSGRATNSEPYKEDNSVIKPVAKVNKDLLLDSKNPQKIRLNNSLEEIRTCKASDANNLSIFDGSTARNTNKATHSGMRSQSNLQHSHDIRQSSEKLANFSVDNYVNQEPELLTEDILQMSYEQQKESKLGLPDVDDVYNLNSYQLYPSELGRVNYKNPAGNLRLKPSSARMKRQSSNSRIRSSKARLKQKDLYTSVKRVRDLTEKCLNGILTGSRTSQKPKRITKKRFKKSKSQPKVGKMQAKCNKNLDKLEKIYQEMIA